MNLPEHRIAACTERGLSMNLGAQPSRLRVAAASRRQHEHRARRPVNSHARLPAIHPAGSSWPQSTASKARRRFLVIGSKAVIFVLALLLQLSFSARAFVLEINSSGNALRWRLDPPDPDVHTNLVNPVSKAIRFFLAADAYSTANTAAELNAVRAAFGQWQSIPGTILKFEDAGLVAAGVDVNTSDNQNVIFWAKNNTTVNGGRDNISGLLGATFNDYFDDNTQIEADIVFNGVQYNWSADFNSADTGKQFIESTAAHEIGHFVGLQHSPVGGATMLFRSPGGVNVQAGLSNDEIAAAKWLYGKPSTLASLGRVRGNVTMNGSAVFGAVVITEDSSSGNLVAGTVTSTAGAYDLPALPPGQYSIYVTPLDPTGASPYLIRGRDISTRTNGVGGYLYDSVQTSFQPTTKVTSTLTAGATVTQNFAVTSGEPAFRITQIRAPSANPDNVSWSSYPASMRQGQSNYFIGVASTNLPASGATLSITGDGLTLGTPVFAFLAGLNFISVPISVKSDATPGLRTFVVQRGNDAAYANGFLEIQPAVPDFNFDGLDDRFQRQYFPLFTSAAAGPNADPDVDGFNNKAEYLSGSIPTNSLSLLRIESVMLTSGGSTLSWKSAAQKRYQVWSRSDVAGDPWQTVGPPVLGTDGLTQFTDSSATNSFRFYRIQALP